MCGRYTLTAPADALRQRFPLGESVQLAVRFNVAPGDEVVTVGLRDGRPVGRLLRWGLVPPWAPDPSGAFKMINARAETVAEKPAYRDAFARRRCLVLADGFYEWRRVGPLRQPYHVTRADGAPFAFAGLWSGWRDPTGGPDGDGWLRTCAIVTTEANARIADIHPRMPVILDPAAEAEWLDPATPPARLHELLRPLPAELTAVRPVSQAVNDARRDGPECLADPAPTAPAAAQPGLF